MAAREEERVEIQLSEKPHVGALDGEDGGSLFSGVRLKAGVMSGVGDGDAGTCLILDLAARCEGGSFVTVLTTLSHDIMVCGGVWGSGLEWRWFCVAIGIMCGMVVESGRGGIGRGLDVEAGVDTGWVDVQSEILEKHSVAGHGDDETQAGFILGLPARREEVSLMLMQVVGGGGFGFTMRREVDGVDDFGVVLILPHGIMEGYGVIWWNFGDGWWPTVWGEIDFLVEMVAEDEFVRKGGKVEVTGVANDGGANFLLIVRKGRKGGGGCLSIDSGWHIAVLIMVDEGYIPFVRPHE